MKLDRKDVKRINRSTVFQYIRSREEQVVSCVQVSRETKLSLPTVLKITDYFEEQGILRSIGQQDATGAGRKPTLLEFVPDSFCTMGVAFDGKYLECVYVNLNYHVLYSHRVALQCDMGRLMAEEIPAQLEGFIAEHGIPLETVIGIGLAIPAAVDTGRYQTTTPSPIIGLKANYDFREPCAALSARFRCPVYIENDVNAAAIGEFKERRLTNRDDLVYITLGTGIGSGIVLNGKIRRGKRFAAGELANLAVGEYGLSSSGATVEALMTPEQIMNLFGYDVSRENGGGGQTEKIRVADYIARHLALVILNLESILNADHYVLGGFVIEHLREYIFDFVRSYLGRCGFPHLDITPVGSLFATSKGAGALASDKALDRILIQDDE